MGVETFVLVNWHEGNIASMNAVATDLQDRYDCTFVAAQACYVAQRLYRDEGGELTHGGGIETLAMLAHDPDAGEGRPGRRADPAAGRDRDGRDAPLPRGLRLHHRRHRARDDGWFGNPAWATPERAETFTNVVADGVLELLDGVMKARDIRRRSRRGEGARWHRTRSGWLRSASGGGPACSPAAPSAATRSSSTAASAATRPSATAFQEEFGVPNAGVLLRGAARRPRGRGRHRHDAERHAHAR